MPRRKRPAASGSPALRAAAGYLLAAAVGSPATLARGWAPGMAGNLGIQAMPASSAWVVVEVAGRFTLSVGPGEALNVVDWTLALNSGLGVPGNFAELEGLLDQAVANCTPNAVNTLYRSWIERVGEQVMVNMGTNSGLQLAGVFLAPEPFGLGTLALFGISQAVGWMMDSDIREDIDAIRDHMATNEYSRREEEGGGGGGGGYDDLADPAWLIDPSGYVYEAVPENRLEGVTATLLQQDPATGDWTVWDATWFGQENTLVTDPEGRYGWDVPEGNWQVAYEKAGYEMARSEVLPVPPPHFDVNTGMLSLAAPAATAVTAAPGGGSVDVTFGKYMRASGDELAGNNLKACKPGASWTAVGRCPLRSSADCSVQHSSGRPISVPL